MFSWRGAVSRGSGSVCRTFPDHLAPRTAAGRKRPVVLVHRRSVPHQPITDDLLANGSHLLQRAVAAAVVDRCARAELLESNSTEREIEHGFRSLYEKSGSPEWRSHRETPLRRLAGRDLHLKDADGDVIALRYDAEADVLAGYSLPATPLNESLESFLR